MPATNPPRTVAVVEGAPTPDVMSGPASVVPLSADPLASEPPGGTAPVEALDGGTLPQETDEATAVAGIAAAPDGAGSGGDDGGGGGGGRQPQDATSPSAGQVAALPPVAAIDAKEVVRTAMSFKGSRVRSAKAKTARSSRAVKDGVGVPKAPRSARSHDAAAAKTELTPRTPSRNKPQVAEVPSGSAGCVAGPATLQAATVAVGERSPLSPEELGAAAAEEAPAVEVAEAEPVVPEPAVPAGVASAKTAAAVVSAAAAGTAGNTPGAGLLPPNGAAAASVVTQSLPAATPHVADAGSPLLEKVPPLAEEYRRQRSRSEPAVPGSRKARVSGVSSHLSSASSASRHMGGAGSSSAGGGGAHGGSSGTFSDSMLSNGSANGSLRLALALSRASSSTSSLTLPATTENLAASARIANGSAVCVANTRRPPSTARARNHGASPSLSMGSGRRVAPHAPSSLRDLRKVSGAFGGRLLALRRERSVGLHDGRGGGGDGSGGDELSGKAAGIAARLGSFDHGGLLGSRKAARDAATVESSPSLLGAADSPGGTPPLRRIYASNGGNRFLASSFSGGTSSSRRLGALLRAASGAAGSATAGMAGRSSSRVRPSRSGHLGTDAVPPGGGGGGSGSGSGGSGGDVPNLDDLTDASARTCRVAPASSTSSNLSLSPAAKAAAISSPTFASSDRLGRRAEGPSQGDRHDGASKIAALIHTDRGRAAKPAERMFATELTSVNQLVASNVQFRETDMASGGRRVSARLRRRPVSVPAVGGATVMPPLAHKVAGGAGKDADARRRFGQPPRLELPPPDKAVEGSASAGELRLSSPVSPPPS